MKTHLLSLASLLYIAVLVYMPSGHADSLSRLEQIDPDMATKAADEDVLWYDALALGIEGQGWTEVQAPYDRLPAKAEGVAPDSVWFLSHHSAGLAIRFVTDASRISARWTLLNKSLAMPHMPATGVSGLDLYVNDAGVWRWIGAGRPDKANNNTSLLAKGVPAGTHEFLLYLPLYNGVKSVEIGVPADAILAKASSRKAKPICIYGTSITQGGCASRPGMAHPAILGRRLHREVINLGFSGSGKMEPEMATLLAELDPSAYVLDCAPNMNPELITERLGPFVMALRKVHPDTPIVVVENIAYQQGAFLPAKRKDYIDKNRSTHRVYKRLLRKGVTGLFYIEGETLLGTDGEGAVDGTHPTDLGFMRMADGFAPVLRECLGE